MEVCERMEVAISRAFVHSLRGKTMTNMGVFEGVEHDQPGISAPLIRPKTAVPGNTKKLPC